MILSNDLTFQTRKRAQGKRMTGPRPHSYVPLFLIPVLSILLKYLKKRKMLAREVLQEDMGNGKTEEMWITLITVIC